jgi:hypothetical protein
MDGMTTTKPAKSAPRGLGPDGKALWRNVTREFEFNSAETELLRQLCVVVDEIAQLRCVLAELGPMVKGSKGQPVLSPVFAQLVSHRKLFDELVVALALPIEGEAAGQRRSAKSKMAADARWRRTKSRGRLNVVGAMQKERGVNG